MSRSDFWARRKAAVQAEGEADLRAQDLAEATARDAEVEEMSDAEILEDLGLPDPESLGEGDDFKAFLAKTVPARIRTRALRRLWLTNPVLANVDGLVDYGEDFTDGAKVIEAMQTAYQVGKGMTRHVEEMARQAEAETLSQEGEVSDLEGEGATDVFDQPDEALADAQVAQDAAPIALTEQPAPDVTALAAEEPEDVFLPRRMRFDFEEVQPEA